jgi:hypothetical protein
MGFESIIVIAGKMKVETGGRFMEVCRTLLFAAYAVIAFAMT